MAQAQPLIAVIDDEETVCRALKRLLIASTLDVMTFSSGELFLQSLAASRPDCVVLDLHMPGMSGLDVLKWMSSTRPCIPAIVITGRDEEASRASCLAAGALAYLPKPLDHSKLLQAIDEALRRTRTVNGGQMPPTVQ
ncbi:MAG: response regulator [Hyphomicrobiales bacterium]|nr:response regulator [Hyphomicrobiales bacterium]MBV9518518.1 response regulator [Hyphomicrobiales bacterium]